MKLTLEHLAPYLPYGLKGTIVYSEDDKEETKLCIRDGLNNESDIDGWINGTYPVLPHLRPLSDLTREIEVNGERFVPIVEMLKELSLIDISSCGFEIGNEEGFWVNADDGDRVVDSLTFDGNIVQMMNNSGDLSPLNPMNDAYRFLDKLHFDWRFNLIESGLAVDINQIEK